MVKNPPANEGDAGSIPWSGRSPGEGNGSPLQYSFLGNPITRGTWRATVDGVTDQLHFVFKREYFRWVIQCLFLSDSLGFVLCVFIL